MSAQKTSSATAINGRSNKAPLFVWVVTGHSESGDDYGPEVYAQKPSDKTLKALVGSWDADDWCGPGHYGSYVYLKIEERKVR